MPEPHDTCDGCGQDNILTNDNTRMMLYLTEHRYNHAAVTCPGCSYNTLLMLAPDDFIRLVVAAKLHMRLLTEAPEGLKRLLAKQLDETSEQLPDIPAPPMPELPPGDHVPTNDELPEPPHEWLVQLYDDMRNFGKDGYSAPA